MSKVHFAQVTTTVTVLTLVLSSGFGCGVDDSSQNIPSSGDPGKAERILSDELKKTAEPPAQIQEATCATAEEFSSIGVDPETPRTSNDQLPDATELPESLSSLMEIEGVDHFAPGAIYPEGDVDWYKMTYINDFGGTAYSTFQPFTALYMEGTHFGSAASSFEVCVFVNQADQAAKGDFQCWGAKNKTAAIAEGDLVGCCTTESGPSGNGGSFDVGEAVLTNDWDLASGEIIPMYVRIRNLGQACQHYRLVYGHFRG